VRLVADTNTVVSGLLWQGPPRQLLDAAFARRLRLYTSAALLAELAEALGRAKFARKVAASTFSAEELMW
jgi:putative PIN family toxin of toxin-antitoxin system